MPKMLMINNFHLEDICRKCDFAKYIVSVFVLIFSESVFSSQACLTKPDFRMFDSTLYTDKPDLTKHGIYELPSISNFWRPKPPGEDVPSLLMVKKATREAKKNKYTEAFVNIEHWPIRGDVNKVYESLIKYKYTLSKVKQEIPNIRIGIYGMIPIRDYWRAIKPESSKEYYEWQTENDRLGVLVSEVDILFPSLYTFYDDQLGWVQYAKANLKEARRISQGKPLYVFLWPNYHDSNKKLKGQSIPRDYFRKQLDIVQQYADGVVFWGGWKNGRMKWDNNMEWWQEVLDFISCQNTHGDNGIGSVIAKNENKIEKAGNLSKDYPVVTGPYFDAGLEYYYVKCEDGTADSLFNDGSLWKFRTLTYSNDLQLVDIKDKLCD